MLDLLLLGENLLVEEIDLLGRDGLVVTLGLLPGRRCFAPNVVKRVLAVGAKLGMLKLPGLFPLFVSISLRQRQAGEFGR